MAPKTTLDYQSPHKIQATKFHLKEWLLLGAGPTNISDRVQKAVHMQCLNPMTPEMFQLMDEVKGMLKYLFQTKNRLTFASQCSGNGGNETILTNLLDPGDKLVVAIGGTWGEKVVDMAKRWNLDVLALRKPPGEVYTNEELEAAIVQHKAALLFVTHGESTGGIIQRLEGLGPICHKHNCLLAVDAVVSIAVDPLFVDRWEIDAVTAGSQKAIGAPPGLCMLTFSERAEKRIQQKKTQPPYYMDVSRLAIYWKCREDPRDYHVTFCSNLMAAAREALAEICEEGLENVWERHRMCARVFWEKVEALGLEIFVKNPENRFHGVTCVNVPKGIDQMEFLNYLKDKYDIVITPGHGPTLGKAIRVGFLGDNSRLQIVEYLVDAMKDALAHFQC